VSLVVGVKVSVTGGNGYSAVRNVAKVIGRATPREDFLVYIY